MERRKKEKLTQKDYHDLSCLMKMHGVQDRYAQAGIEMYNECKDLYLYLKDLIKLNKLLKESKPIMNENEMDSTTAILKKSRRYVCKEQVLPIAYSSMFIESYSS